MLLTSFGHLKPLYLILKRQAFYPFPSIFMIFGVFKHVSYLLLQSSPKLVGEYCSPANRPEYCSVEAHRQTEMPQTPRCQCHFLSSVRAR